MKKVLLIGYPFPLRQGGSPRLLGLAKYLREFGWESIILTAPLDQKSDGQFTIVATGYQDALGIWGKLFKINRQGDARKQIRNRLGIKSKKSLIDSLLTLGGEIINYPDSEKGWKRYAVKAGEEILANKDIDAIISTSAPVTAHVIARILKKQFDIPWIADLRDLWTQNHNYYYGRLRKLIDRNLELKTLGTADALTTVSPPWAGKLRALHENNKIYSITNGFDPKTLNTPPAKLTDVFTITYTGIIYPDYQNPTPLFAALSQLIEEKTIDLKKLEIRFYGPREEWLEKEASQYGLSNNIHQYGQVSRETALLSQRESQILLLLNWNDPQESGTIPGKVFEYMAAMRPIIALGGSPDDAVQQILCDTKAGYHATSITEIKEWLRKRYSEYLFYGKVTATDSDKLISQHSQLEMARKFAEILEQLTNRGKKS